MFLFNMNYYPEQGSHSGSKTKVKLDLFNYATKSEVTCLDTLEVAKKADKTA